MRLPVERQLVAIEQEVEPKLVGARIARPRAERDQAESALRDAEPETPSNHDELAALLADLPDLSEHLREADADTKRMVFDAFDLPSPTTRSAGPCGSRCACRRGGRRAGRTGSAGRHSGGPLRPAAQPETRVSARSLTEGGLILAASAQHAPNPVGSIDVMVRLVSDVGETIENPINGERITWIETAETTGGELLSLDLSLRPGATVAAEHRHMRQEERFRVDAGSIGLGLEGVERTVSEGEEVTVPAGVPHRWWNEGTVEATVRVELRPALDTQTFFETFFGLARDGKTNDKGIPGLLQIAVAYRDLGDSCPTLAKPPAFVQRIISALLAPIGRSVGRRAVYARYSPRHAALATRTRPK